MGLKDKVVSGKEKFIQESFIICTLYLVFVSIVEPRKLR
jgi:hypothetical protein